MINKIGMLTNKKNNGGVAVLLQTRWPFKTKLKYVLERIFLKHFNIYLRKV
jgi:hypothetical protein